MRRQCSRRVVLTCLGVLLAWRATAQRATTDVRLATEIERWSKFFRENTSTDEMWKQVKGSVGPALERVEKARQDKRDLAALLRFASVRENLSASAYLQSLPAEARRPAGFEAEWKRMGGLLKPALTAASPRALEGIEPLALRALGEAALPKPRIYYDASVEYGRNTMPDSGLYYIGAAQSQVEFVALARSLSVRTGQSAPAVRAIDGELQALESEMLAVYRPPLSIDQHPEFISASSALKEAKELNAAGLRYGALLRYLQAAVRFAPLRPGSVDPDPAAVARNLRSLRARLDAKLVDHSVGRMMLEVGEAELEAPPAGPRNAAAIADDVLPRYLAALEPARSLPAAVAPRARVTLVRWPYT